VLRRPYQGNAASGSKAFLQGAVLLEENPSFGIDGISRCWERNPNRNPFLFAVSTQFEKYESKWIISQNRGENTKYLKPPPSLQTGSSSPIFGVLFFF